MKRPPAPSLFPPDPAEIQRTIARVLAEVQRMAGTEVLELRDDTCPLTDIEGFDSLTAQEAIVMLGGEYEVTFPYPFNPFVDSTSGEPTTMKDAVAAFAAALATAPKAPK